MSTNHSTVPEPPAMLLKPLLNRVHPVKGYRRLHSPCGSRMASWRGVLRRVVS